MDNSSPGTRRVTGSSNIPISKEGEAQAQQMVESLSHRFDHVFCSPEDRAVETAGYFGDPIILKGLDAWYRGSYEGKPAKLVSEAMRNLILHPKMKAPGKSPLSGKAGESYDEFLGPLMRTMRLIKEHYKPGEWLLVVTSGGNLQAIDHFAPKGFPEKRDPKDYQEIAKSPYWAATGVLFELTENGLKELKDNKGPGIYCIEHGATIFNRPTNSKAPAA